MAAKIIDFEEKVKEKAKENSDINEEKSGLSDKGEDILELIERVEVIYDEEDDSLSFNFEFIEDQSEEDCEKIKEWIFSLYDK